MTDWSNVRRVVGTVLFLALLIGVPFCVGRR